MNTAAADIRRDEVQRLALSGYGAECSRHFILEVSEAAAARGFIAELLRRGWICHSASYKHENQPLAGEPGNPVSAVNIGFTFQGLDRLQLAKPYLDELRVKAPAFAEGAPPRAAQHLGDTGASAAECWEAAFDLKRAHVLLTIHADDDSSLDEVVTRLRKIDGANTGLAGWENRLSAQHLETREKEVQDKKKEEETGKKRDDEKKKDRKIRLVHFGFRDGIGLPVIEDKPGQRHQPGELLLGHPNDEGYNRWEKSGHKGANVEFFHNGSFAVFRKIEQHEEAFRDFLDKRVKELSLAGVVVTADCLKAKMCGRWPNGALVQPGEFEQPKSAPDSDSIDGFDFTKDPDGLGCPFGSHIRRTNPRNDPIVQERRRPLFRRGMPYGPWYDDDPKAERGLIGLFFCASIEDQFEHLMSQWVDKVPLGPNNRGKAKDPLIGNHDEVGAAFHIPQANGPAIELHDFEPFVTTRGALYAFFPNIFAIRQIAAAAEPRPAASAAPSPQRVVRAGLPMPQPTPQPAPNADLDAPKITEDTAPKDRYCDVVLEGGVTSGVIYPWAVAELAKDYRFQKIGGTSIGAFAAAVTAAAEYQRRRGSVAGFQQLIGLPDWLAETGPNGGPTQLQRMFRPEPQTKRLFEIFLATLDRGSAFSRVAAGTIAAFRQYKRSVVTAAVVSFLLVAIGPALLVGLAWRPLTTLSRLEWVAFGSLGYSLLLAAAFSLAAAISVVVWSIWRDFIDGLVPNGFGLCRGGPVPDEDSAAPTLTTALHELIQRAAGRDVYGPPLTFEDLWTAPGFPPQWLATGVGSGTRSIDLQVYSTNLTHSRPYRFPLDEADGVGRLFFKAEELAPYFPKTLIGHLVGYAEGYEPKSSSDPPISNDTRDLLELPYAKLPIAVAARLSLSFPVLISAVPLWAIDYEPRREERKLGSCWFSDGGLCSNFPIHLFDSFVPKWPTFGISLQKRGKYRPEQRVWLPKKHFEGRGDTWDRFGEEKAARRRLRRFLFSLWNAAWRWNDSTTMRMPGVRDRVVRILLEDGEGGVNIKMTAGQIKALAKNYGLEAAREFRKKFIKDDGRGWHEHRWVRFNTLLVALRERITGLTTAAESTHHAIPLSKQIGCAQYKAPLREPDEMPLHADQINELQQLLAALKRLECDFLKAGDFKPYVPEPRPSLRIRHPT